MRNGAQKKPALIADDEILSWAEFVRRLNQVGNGLNQAGLATGDRVIVFMSNSGAMAEILFGIMKGGFVSAPLNVTVSDEAVKNMILDSGAKAVFASGEYTSRLSAVLEAMGDAAPKILIASGEGDTHWQAYRPWRERQSSDGPKAGIAPHDYLNIIYSSGTTGQPKGIAHTHQGRLSWAYDLAIALRYNSASRFLATIGLYSNITWVGMLSTLLSGGTVVVSPNFDAGKVWQDIDRHKVTHLCMVPIVYERLMDQKGL